jgi:NMD protein affecting ribosome stability and mRNA decay
LDEGLSNVLKTTLNRYVDSNQNVISEVVIQRMPSTMDSSSIVVPVTVRFKTLKQEHSHLANNVNMSVRLIPTICPNCGLVKREYYEATLQIRAIDGNMVQQEKTILLDRINSLVDKIAEKHKQAFVTRFENKPGGVDLYLGSSQLAHSIASRFRSRRGVLTKEAFKMGKLDKSTGKKKGKVTILIRLPHSEIEDLAKKGF